MNCNEAREQLPALSYSDLDPATEHAVQEHLASCPACKLEFAALERVSRSLDSLAVQSVQVDLPRLFQEATARQARRARRWRRVAIAVCGVAATLLLVVLLRLEVRVQAHQLVIRWGSEPADVGPREPLPVERVVMRDDPAALAALQDRLLVLDELVHALITDVSDRDNRQSERLALLVDRLDELRRQNGRRLSETERNVAAMYTAMFVVPKKGEKP